MMAGQSSLWWVKASAANGLEATAVSDTTNFADGEVILFNETPSVTAGGHVFTTEFNIRQSIPENPKVDGNNNDTQDMGMDGIDVQVVGLIKDIDATWNNSSGVLTSPNNSIMKIMNWLNESKTTTGYTEGRFGLRLDDFPYFNMIPTSTYGYILQSMRFIRNPDEPKKIGFVMILRVGGDVKTWLDINYAGE